MVATAISSASDRGEALRAAATMMVVRDGDHPDSPLEVLMLRRTLFADFMGGAYVFPGGSVDATDAEPEVAARCEDLDDASASAILDIASGGLAYWVACLRECFEEAGLLLCRPRSGGATVSFTAPDEAARFIEHRRALNAGEARFDGMLAAEDLLLTTGAVHYFAHWITPEGAPRRYDTRFFVAPAPTEQTPVHDASETIADIWVRPIDALAMHARGELELILPTIKTLQAISRFSTAGDLLAAAARMRAVPSVLPRVVADGRGLRILLPGDPGYDEAMLAERPTAEMFDAATRAASRAAAEETVAALRAGSVGGADGVVSVDPAVGP